MFKAIEDMTAGIRQRAALMVGRCILRAISDTSAVQLVQCQLLADEIQDDVERIQQYGFTSVPLPGAEGVVVFVGGNRDHGLLIAVEDRRYRLQGLEGGEVALYDDQDQKIHLTRTGITVHTPMTFRVEADTIQLHASSLFQFDCNGHGQKWYPTKVDTWQIGETAGAAHNISPPEI